MICWRYLHGEGFAASQLAITSGLWNFFGSDLHLDFCTRGCPPPRQPLAAPYGPDLFTLSLPYSSRRLWKRIWSAQSGFYPLCPTPAGTQWTGSRFVTPNSLCRFCAVPPVWPICSPEIFPWCSGQSSFESNHKAIGSLVTAHPVFPPFDTGGLHLWSTMWKKILAMTLRCHRDGF